MLILAVGIIAGQALDHGNAKKQKNDNVSDGADHLDKVLDRGVGFARNIRESIVGLDNATADHADDAGPMEYFGRHVRKVGHG